MTLIDPTGIKRQRSSVRVGGGGKKLERHTTRALTFKLTLVRVRRKGDKVVNSTGYFQNLAQDYERVIFSDHKT